MCPRVIEHKRFSSLVNVSPEGVSKYYGVYFLYVYYLLLYSCKYIKHKCMVNKKLLLTRFAEPVLNTRGQSFIWNKRYDLADTFITFPVIDHKISLEA